MLASGPAGGGGAVTHELSSAMQAASASGRNLIAGGRKSLKGPAILTCRSCDHMSRNCHTPVLDCRERHHDRTYLEAVRPGPRGDPLAYAADGRAGRIAGAPRGL